MHVFMAKISFMRRPYTLPLPGVPFNDPRATPLVSKIMYPPVF